MSKRRNEQTSTKIGTIAAKGLRNPGSLTKTEIRRVSGSALTQLPDRPRTVAKSKGRK